MINLYYDKMINKTTPVPNGVTSYELNNSAIQMPVYNGDPIIPLNHTVEFYYVALLNKIKLRLYTGDVKNVENLYYPLELNDLEDIYQRDLRPHVTLKTINRINKGKFKLLIFAQKMELTYYSVSNFKKRIDELVEAGLEKDRIIIVLNDTKCSYKELLKYKIIGFDWWQVYCQILFKDLYDIKSSSIYFPADKNFKKRRVDKSFQMENFKPKKLFKALTTAPSLSNYSLLTSLHYHGLNEHGDYYYRSDLFKMPKLEEVVDGDIIEKEKILKNLPEGIFYKNVDNRFQFDDNYSEYLLHIVTDNNSPEYYTPYKSEWLKCTTTPRLWQQIFLGHPFIVFGNVNIHLYLNNEGYFTYNELVPPHTYDNATVMSRKADIISKQLMNIRYENYTELFKTVKAYAVKNKEIFIGQLHHKKFTKFFLDIKAVSVV